MKIWLTPPLSRHEKRILSVVLPVACTAALLAGYAFGGWLWS